MHICLYILIIYRMYIISCCLFLISHWLQPKLHPFSYPGGCFFIPWFRTPRWNESRQRSLGPWSPRMARRAGLLEIWEGCWFQIWMFPKIVGFPPKSSILICGFPLYTIYFGVPQIFGNTHISRKFLSFATQMTDSEKESDHEKESNFCCQGLSHVPFLSLMGMEKLAFDWNMSHDISPLSCVKRIPWFGTPKRHGISAGWRGGTSPKLASSWNMIIQQKSLALELREVHGTSVNTTYIWLIFMVHVGRYTIHEKYG